MATIRWKHNTGRALLPAAGLRPSPSPAVAPPAAPSVGAQALPVDPAYDAAIGAASFNLQTGMLGAQYQRGQLGQTYGLGIRPDGTVFDDPSNPYSRAAELQKAYKRSQRGAQTSLAAQGQLYSGAYQNAQNENANVLGRNQDANIRGFMAAQQGITQSEQSAQGAFLSSQAAAESERIARALANRPLPEAVVPTPAPKPKPKAKPKGKK